LSHPVANIVKPRQAAGRTKKLVVNLMAIVLLGKEGASS
jgi:hypothetical protein